MHKPPVENRAKYRAIKARWQNARNAFYHVLLAIALLSSWYLLTEPVLLSPKAALRMAFYFGRPLEVISVITEWFISGKIYPHLAITLWETGLAFAIGVILGIIFGLWLALSPTADSLLDPYMAALNAMPRVILAPIFVVWFGIGMSSKVALGVTLVFFIVFFNVYQGIKEVSPTLLSNARMLGATPRQLLRAIYIPSATAWVFSSLHTSVGMAFVGAVVGEYLGSSAGIGYLILQAESVFDISTVFAGIFVLTFFAVVLDRVVTHIERRMLRWRPTQSQTQ